MKRFGSCLLVCIALFVRMGIASSVSTGTVVQLDALVGRWMGLRASLAEENRVWKARQAQWEEQIRLLELEKEALQAELEEARNDASFVERERETVLARREAYEAVLDGLLPALDRAELHLREWAKVVPLSLDEGLPEAMTSLPGTQTQAAVLPVTERAQRVVALYTRLETLQNGIHSTTEMLASEAGERLLMDVLYIGLASAMAVSTDDKRAAVGVPTPAGWQWQPRPELAGQIREALKIFARDAEIKRVALPLRVAGPKTAPVRSGHGVAAGQEATP